MTALDGPSFESFECRVDNQLLASWIAGAAKCGCTVFKDRVENCIEILRGLVQHQNWQLRDVVSNMVLWIPRERNVFADALANEALDHKFSFSTEGPRPCPNDANFVTVSDGACRGGGQSSSAAWAIFAVRGEKLDLVAAGAVLHGFTNSMDAELSALELAMAALVKLTRGCESIVPHATDVIYEKSEFEKTFKHLWDIS